MKLNLGKCDDNGDGRKNCDAVITWELKAGAKGLCFSAQAETWLPSRRDIIRSGQCVDDVAAMFPENALAARICEVWKKWHLNDMRSGCVHQRAAWNIAEPLEVVTYKLKHDAYKLREDCKTRASVAAVSGAVCELTATEKALLACKWYEDINEPPDADSPLSGCYEVSKRETKPAGWVYPKEHPRGLLCKPCEVCGYQYGSAWLFEPLPAELVAEIESWSSMPGVTP